MTKQRELQLAYAARGRCEQCGKPCVRYLTAKGVEKRSKFCRTHWERRRTLQRRRLGIKIGYPAKIVVDNSKRR